MRFSDDSLADVLKYVQYATQDRDGHIIPIYVASDGSLFNENVLAGTVRIELEGVPLKTSLRLCLQQRQLDYDVRDGLLLIGSERLVSPVPPDPSYLTAGHCVLALIAAVVGGVLAPIVSDLRRRPGS